MLDDPGGCCPSAGKRSGDRISIRAFAIALLTSGLLAPTLLRADPPTPDTQVGDIITNPATGLQVEVLYVVADINGEVTYVVTADGDVILTKYSVGDLVACIEPDENDACAVYEVVSVEEDPDTGWVVVVNLQLQVAEPDPENPEPITPQEVVRDESGAFDDGAAANEGAPGDPEFVPPQANAGLINEVGTGASGRGGGNAYGVRICIPLIGCANIGKSGSAGEAGATGPAINRTVAASHGAIGSISPGVHGIRLGSIGGNGGKGGDSYGNIGPYNGGDGGAGGPITLNTVVEISTTANNSHGIFVFSRSGRGGDGGDSFLGSGGGSGGSARTGGTGIGLAIARHFVDRGANVMFADIDEDALEDKLEAAKADLADEYSQDHDFPWIIGFSGGKDSTLVLQLTMEMLLELPPSERKRTVHVVSNDTLVEAPVVADLVDRTLDRISDAVTAMRLPIVVAKTTPKVDQTFWVNLIGRGYPSPSRTFRWCTDRMKIQPTSHYIRSRVSENGKAILLLGVRRQESATRAVSMSRYDNGERLNDHNDLKGCKVFRPIVEFSTNEVWTTLLQRRPPWGGSHRDLVALYKDGQGSECPLVLSKDDAPSCGTSSSRFGCWTCTVVVKDRSLAFLLARQNELTPVSVH